jgi:GNAT superfamily N-acetyltransferase
MLIGLDGYELTPVGDPERSYFLSCMRKTVLESVSPEEAGMSELWIDIILGTVEANLDVGIRNEAFVLRCGDGRRCGVLWMGESKDQYTCDDTGYILSIYIEEGMRGIGLGKALMLAAEQWCRDRGFLSVTLNVGALNRGARAFYDDAGFYERSSVMRKDLPR